MKSDLFKQQVDRLNAQFNRAFSEEKTALLWREVSEMSDDWMRITVDKFIGDCRYAPMLKEFREEVAVSRERLHERQKERNRVESESAMRQIFDGPMITSICKTITDRMRGGVTDQTFEQFTRGIAQLAHQGCRQCDNSGLCFRKDSDGYEFVYRCYCPIGDRQPEAYLRIERRVAPVIIP